MESQNQKKKSHAEINSFSAQYDSPEWQKKRLHIMELDGFKCRRCKSDLKTLHVHHLKYTKGAKPWEYPDSNLVTLCESCHEEFHWLKKDIEDELHLYFEAWITNSEKTNVDCVDIKGLLYDLCWVKKENRKRFINLISAITAFAHFNQDDLECEALTRDELQPINCEDSK